MYMLAYEPLMVVYQRMSNFPLVKSKQTHSRVRPVIRVRPIVILFSPSTSQITQYYQYDTTIYYCIHWRQWGRTRRWGTMISFPRAETLRSIQINK